MKIKRQSGCRAEVGERDDGKFDVVVYRADGSTKLMCAVPGKDAALKVANDELDGLEGGG